MTRTLEEYLELPYRLTLLPARDEEGRAGFIAEVDELPGCMSQGATEAEAIAGLRDAMAGWISVALEDGRTIPEPHSCHDYSGRFVLRLPVGLHAELARSAEAEGVSLNAFVASALAGAVHWRMREPA